MQLEETVALPHRLSHRVYHRGYVGSGGTVTDFGLTELSTPILFHHRREVQWRRDDNRVSPSPGDKRYKLCREQAIPLSGDEGLPALERMVAEMDGSGRASDLPSSGSYRTGNLTVPTSIPSQAHSQPKTSDYRYRHRGGMAGPEIRQFFLKFPSLAPVAVNLDPDGNFPHHGANPFLDSATDELKGMVLNSGADFGVAFDGDADRCIFVDERGERIPSDLVTALIARQYLAREPGATFLYDLRSSRVVAETVSRLGGRAIRCRVGHAFIKEQMRQENALFAGELSGHYYFRDMGFCDNGIFAMAQMVNLLSVENQPLSLLLSPLKKYSSTGEINIRVNKRDSIVAYSQSRVS